MGDMARWKVSERQSVSEVRDGKVSGPMVPLICPNGHHQWFPGTLDGLREKGVSLTCAACRQPFAVPGT